MSTSTIEPESQSAAAASAADVEDYRAVCSASVTSAVIAVVGLSSFWLAGFLLIALVGLLLGIYALATVRRRSEELTGSGLATIAIAISVTTLVTAGAWHTYVYATEVPDGFERISYRQLQADPSRPGNQIPTDARELDGTNVFIKGFMMPGNRQSGIKAFLLCRDKGECCFGGEPKINDRILVMLEDDQTIDFTGRLIKIVGEFRIPPSALTAQDAPGVVLYTLKGKHLK